jgi:hypothetical protein
VGCIQALDPGRELRFKSTDELLAFLADCFAARSPNQYPTGLLQE